VVRISGKDLVRIFGTRKVMQKYQPIAIQAVAENVRGLQTELSNLRNEMRSHEDWYKRFKDSLDAHNNQIGSLSRELASEAAVRKGGQDQLTEAVTSIQQTLTFLKGASWVVAIILGVAGTLFVAWLVKQLGWV
jgi:hypothetical protein